MTCFATSVQVRKVFHHLGITLGSALDSMLSLGLTTRAKKKKPKKIVAKKAYFQNANCAMEPTDPCIGSYRKKKKTIMLLTRYYIS